MSTLQNTDLMVVQRGTTAHKITWSDVSAAVLKSLPAALLYMGTWAPTATAPAPTGGLKAGMTYVLTPAGTLHSSWTGIGGVAASDGQLAIWEGSKWELVGNSGSLPIATEAIKGIVELATAAETTTGTDNTRAVHPAGLKVELDKKLNLAGGTMTGHLSSTERTITASAFNLATGNFWHCGAIAIPNPTNATAGTSGLIRLTAAPTGWGSNFKHAGGSATAPKAFPAIVPFYAQSATVILVGKPVEGMA
jgi:hypothetical protein